MIIASKNIVKFLTHLAVNISNEMTFQDLTSLFAMLLSLVAILFTAYTISKDTKVNRAIFWLNLRERFSAFDEVHLKLRPGGEWASNNSGPVSSEDWAKVESYMGLFEHCNIMLNEGLVDKKTFRKIYSYRLKNLVNNKTIADAKLRDKYRSEYWKDFIELLGKFDIKYQ